MRLVSFIMQKQIFSIVLVQISGLSNMFKMDGVPVNCIN